MTSNLWTRDEMIITLNLYLKTPFGKIHKNNPEIIRLARLIHRTPNAVAIRLANYAAFDPQLKQRGISGMTHGGTKAKEYWEEFINNREQLIFESERIKATLEGSSIEEKYASIIRNHDLSPNLIGETKMRQIKARVNQYVFRQIVLANYESKCALSGIDIPELLVASHIIPWVVNKQERLNPENGICLSSLYDKAFDQGLISFDDSYRVIFSQKLYNNMHKAYFTRYFKSIYKKKLSETKKYNINQDFLKWHREFIFIN